MRLNLAPMLETTITKSILKDEYVDQEDRCNSIGSDDVVVILNPTKYTLDDSDEDVINEEVLSSLNDSRDSRHFKESMVLEPNDIMNQLKIAYKEKKYARRQNRNNNSSRRNNLRGNRNNSDSTDDDIDDEI